MAVILSEHLPQFLKTHAGRVFRWGKADCALFLADWCVAIGCPDPGAEYRGQYDSAEASLDVMGEEDLVGIIGRLALRLGFNPTQEPQTGDVGVVDIPRAGAVCAIFSNGSWVFRTERGIAWAKPGPGRLVKAWRVEWPK